MFRRTSSHFPCSSWGQELIHNHEVVCIIELMIYCLWAFLFC